MSKEKVAHRVNDMIKSKAIQAIFEQHKDNLEITLALNELMFHMAREFDEKIIAKDKEYNAAHERYVLENRRR